MIVAQVAGEMYNGAIAKKITLGKQDALRGQ